MSGQDPPDEVATLHGLGRQESEDWQRSHPRTTRAPHGEAHLVDPCSGIPDEASGILLPVGGLGQSTGVSQHLPKGVRVERDHPWPGFKIAR